MKYLVKMPGVRRFVRFKKDERGVTAIEFAFVAVPFFFLIIGILEIGLTLGAQYSLDHGVSVASRLIRTGQAQGMNRAQFVDEVCQSAVVLSNCPTKLRVDVKGSDSFSTMQTLPQAEFANGGAVSGNDDVDPLTGIPLFEFSAGTRQQPMIVTVAYEWELVGLFSSMLQPSTAGRDETTRRNYLSLGNLSNGNRLLVATEIFRNEPF